LVHCQTPSPVASLNTNDNRRQLRRTIAKLLIVDSDGRIKHLPRAALACLFSPGDLVIANDAATLPASLECIHAQAAIDRGSARGMGVSP
jgi:S-adenosylmethionine:tRNA-ribosyltransferase-isomerase (queuine synthetase)